MAIIAYIKESKQSISAMKAVLDYCAQDKKILDAISGRKLVSGVNCNGEKPFLEFMATKYAHAKSKGMNFYHYTQSFSPEEKVTPEQAHQIAIQFAEKAWPGHEVLVATHTDDTHIHSHFVINAVAFESGQKLRQNPNTLKQLRRLSDQLCIAHHLSVLKPYEGHGTRISTREYRTAAKGQSWKFKLMADIDSAMEFSGSKRDFLREMHRRGYDVRWENERKYITFTCPNSMKCRDIKLHEAKYLKENIEYELHLRERTTLQFCLGSLEAEEFPCGFEPGTAALRAGSLRHSSGAAARGNGIAEAGSDLPAGTVPPDFGPGNPGRIKRKHHHDAADPDSDDGAGGEESGIREQQGDPFHEGDRVTGWEGSREVYFHYFLHGDRQYERDESTGFQYAPPDVQADLEHRSSLGSAVHSGLRGLLAVGNLTAEEDPEEQKKQAEAQQTAENVGVLIGLTAGVTQAVQEHNKNNQPTMETM